LQAISISNSNPLPFWKGTKELGVAHYIVDAPHYLMDLGPIQMQVMHMQALCSHFSHPMHKTLQGYTTWSSKYIIFSSRFVKNWMCKVWLIGNNQIYMNDIVVSLTLWIYQLYELYWVFTWNNILYFGLTKDTIF
jgi:hypothetical protein